MTPVKKVAHSEDSHEITSVSSQRNCGTGNFLLISLLIISIVLNALGVYLLMGYSLSLSSDTDSLGIKRALLEMEYDKVGGKENYDLLAKAQLIQFKETLPQLKQFVESQGGNTPSTEDTATSSNESILDTEKLTKIMSDAAIEGDKDALITVIEYSDMECPFCIRQYQDTKLSEKLLAQYGSGVNFVFKNNRGVNHPGTEAKAIAALCAQNVGGDEAYIEFYHAIMDGTTNEGGVYDVAKLPSLAKSFEIDTAKWQKCYDNKETQSIFAAQTAEAGSFKLDGTPGTVIINNKTGKYMTVAGAYPYESFTEKIDELMK